MPYFGKFPEWAPLYFESIKRNPTINFVFYTDCDFNPYKAISNIVFKKMEFEDYILFVNNRIKAKFCPADYYKICDLRPFFPIIHEEDISGYSFYGWSDMDLLFGDIRLFYPDTILNKYDVISSHAVRISGHFALFRNKRKNKYLYRKIYNWKKNIEYPYFVGIDEHGITNALSLTLIDKFFEKFRINVNLCINRLLKKAKTRKIYLFEQYTTPFTKIPWIDGSINSMQPDEWYYRDGIITNNRDGDRRFMYLHFMNFKSSRWRHDGTKAPWENKEKIVFCFVEDMKDGIKINKNGIYPIDHI